MEESHYHIGCIPWDVSKFCGPLTEGAHPTAHKLKLCTILWTLLTSTFSENAQIEIWRFSLIRSSTYATFLSGEAVLNEPRRGLSRVSSLPVFHFLHLHLDSSIPKTCVSVHRLHSHSITNDRNWSVWRVLTRDGCQLNSSFDHWFANLLLAPALF